LVRQHKTDQSSKPTSHRSTGDRTLRLGNYPIGFADTVISDNSQDTPRDETADRHGTRPAESAFLLEIHDGQPSKSRNAVRSVGPDGYRIAADFSQRADDTPRCAVVFHRDEADVT
jgi:hypothetical protein